MNLEDRQKKNKKKTARKGKIARKRKTTKKEKSRNSRNSTVRGESRTSKKKKKIIKKIIRFSFTQKQQKGHKKICE